MLAALPDAARVGFVTRLREMYLQTAHIAERLGVPTPSHLSPKGDIAPYDVIIVSEELRDLELPRHPCIVRF